MRTDFRGDPQGYHASRAELVDEVLAWLHDILEPDRNLLETVLDVKFDLDGRLGFWRQPDIADVIDGWDAAPHHPSVPTVTQVQSVGLILRWLQAERLLDPGSDPIAVILGEIDYLTDEFDDDDEDDEDDDEDDDDDDGPDPVDVGLTDSWPYFDELDGTADPVEQPVFPPVVLPSAAELIGTAEASTVLRQVRALLVWLSNGKPLDANGRLRKADLGSLGTAMGLDVAAAGTARSQVTLVVEWSRAAGLVRKAKGRLLPAKAAGSLRHKPIELWERLFSRFDGLGAQFVSPGRREAGEAEFADGFGDIWAATVMGLYEGNSVPTPMEVAYHVADEAMTMVNPFTVRNRRSPKVHPVARRATREAISALERLGAVQVTVADVELLKVLTVIAGTSKPDLELVRLTPIGLWAVHRLLAESGADVVEVRQLLDRPAVEFARRLDGASAETSDVAWAAWVDARGEAAAAAELERALRDAGSPEDRIAVMIGLPATGSAGVQTGLRLRSSGGVPGALAAGYLVDQGVIDVSLVSRPEAVLAMADMLTVAADDGALLGMLSEASMADQVELVRSISRSGHPQAVRLLDEIAGNHPNRRVARAAGKERLRLRSSGAS